MPAHASAVGTEQQLLLGFLDQQRRAVTNASYGLTDDQVADAASASTLSVGGILKHLAAVERSWTATMLAQPLQADEEAYAAGFDPSGMTRDELLADYAAAAAATDKVVRDIDDLDHQVPVPPAPWFPKDIDAWSLRWVLLHLIEETARHAGHADIVREAVDGAPSIRLLAAVEGWPADGWVTPWTTNTTDVSETAEAGGVQ